MAGKRKDITHGDEALTPNDEALTPNPSPSGRGEEDVFGTRAEAIAAALGDPALAELAIHESEATLPVDADGFVQDAAPADVRTDGFVVLTFGMGRLPVGLRLGTMARAEVRGVSGELSEDAGGLVAWFTKLPGEVRFRDGTRAVLRADPGDGYVVDTL